MVEPPAIGDHGDADNVGDLLQDRSSGNFEDSANVSTRGRHAVWALLAAAVLTVLWTLLWDRDESVASPRVDRGKTLDAWFNQLQGFQGDTVIATFREIGPDAVIFLGAKSRKYDSVLKRGYIALWPKLSRFAQIASEAAHQRGSDSRKGRRCSAANGAEVHEIGTRPGNPDPGTE